MSDRSFVIICAMSEELNALLDDDLRAHLLQRAAKELGVQAPSLPVRLREADPATVLPNYAAEEDPSDLARLPHPVKTLFDIDFYPVNIGGRQGYACQSGIGLVNAARATTLALTLGVEQVFYCGTAGGLAADSRVGDVVFGEWFTEHDADATAFGYTRGQLPGMPALYPADQEFIAKARLFTTSDARIGVAPIVSGDKFVTAANVSDVRAAFPKARACEMENSAAAQVCWRSGAKFAAVRAISDLCSPDGDEVFHVNCSVAAALAANALLCVLNQEG